MPGSRKKIGVGSKYQCPKCNYLISKVLESRYKVGNHYTRRRRQCCACLHRYTTVEIISAKYGEISPKFGFISQSEAISKKLKTCQTTMFKLENDIQTLLDTMPI